MQVKSPLTHTNSVHLEEELSVDLICEQYAKDYKIEVRSYFGGLSSIQIYKCLDTGYRFYFPLNLLGDNNLYQKLQEEPWYYCLRIEHQIAETFCNPGDSVLEIGCGRGYFLERLHQKEVSCMGLEFNEDTLRFGREKGLTILNQSIEEHSKENFEKYDIVCHFQVLEHVPQVHDFLKASIDALKIGGRLIIGVPNNNPFLFQYDKYNTLNLPPHHMGLWDVTSLKSLQNLFNLSLDKIFIEPLQPWDYNYYFNVQAQYLKSHSRILEYSANVLLLSLKPSRLRWALQKAVARSIQGRNILAVYTKLS